MSDERDIAGRIEAAIDSILGPAADVPAVERQRIRGIVGVLRELPLDEPPASLHEWASGLLAAQTRSDGPPLSARLTEWLDRVLRSARTLVLAETQPDPAVALAGLRSVQAPVRTFHGVAGAADGEPREAWLDLQAEPADEKAFRVRGQMTLEPASGAFALHVVDLDSGAAIATIAIADDGGFAFTSGAARIALVAERPGDDRPLVVREVVLKRA
jgi:hypothetical protein